MYLTKTVDITGTFIADEDVLIDGTIDGYVSCKMLTISEHAEIFGVVVAQRVVVSGAVVADIYADEIVLKSGCKVEGEIYHKILNLDQDCYFEGKSRRVDDPAAIAPAPFEDDEDDEDAEVA